MTRKGIYVLFIDNKRRKKIRVGALGKILFPEDRYCYVGSALNSLFPRIKRHLRQEKKKHWHIDYLMEEMEIRKIAYGLTEKEKECTIARNLSKKLDSAGKIGASDCNCGSHFFAGCDRETIEKAFQEEKLNPVFIKPSEINRIT